MANNVYYRYTATYAPIHDGRERTIQEVTWSENDKIPDNALRDEVGSRVAAEWVIGGFSLKKVNVQRIVTEDLGDVFFPHKKN